MTDQLCPIDSEHGPMAEIVAGRFWACPICDGTCPDDVKATLSEMFTKPFSELSVSDLKAQRKALIGVVMGVPFR